MFKEMCEKLDGKNCWTIDGMLFAKFNDTVHKILTGRDLQNVISNRSVLNLL